MEANRRDRILPWAFAGALFVFVAALLVARLAGFGIWDPWELEAADAARHVADGDELLLRRPPLATWLVSLGFQIFGVLGWAGRLPMVVAGLVTLVAAYALAARFAGWRAGLYAALVTGTTPLFLFNARQMLGDAPAFATHALIALCAMAAVFRPTAAPDASMAARWRACVLWLAGLAVSIVLAVLARGALLGALPPLVAVAIVAGLDGTMARPKRDLPRAVAAYVVAAVAVALCALAEDAVWTDAGEYSHFLGGKPRGGNPPTFDAPIEDVFHAFAPWSAFLLLAFGRMLWPKAVADGGEQPLLPAPPPTETKTTGAGPYRAAEMPVAADATELRESGVGYLIGGGALAVLGVAFSIWGALASHPSVMAWVAIACGVGLGVRGALALAEAAKRRPAPAPKAHADAEEKEEAEEEEEEEEEKETEKKEDDGEAAEAKTEEEQDAADAKVAASADSGDVMEKPGTGTGTGSGTTEEVMHSVRLVLVIWAAVGYAALVLFTSRYGPGTYVPVVALAAMVALFLRDVEESGRAWWAAAVVSVLFVGLIIRDYFFYPGSAIDGLGIDGVTFPDAQEWNPYKLWAVFLGLFAVAAWFGLGWSEQEGFPDVRRPYRLIAEQWRRGTPFKIWLCFIAALLFGIIVFGLLCLVFDTALPVNSIAIKWGKRLLLLPFGTPVAVLLVQVGLYLFRRLGRLRLLPLLLCGAAVGAYAAQGYLPSLSAHLSPREVYDTFNNLAREGDELGEYRVGTRAAAYYARSASRELNSQPELVDYLADPGRRRWAVLPTDELPAVNRLFRQRTGRHLFVPEMTSSRVVLVTNRDLRNRENQNYLARYVLDEPPRMQHPVRVQFEDKIELIGYDLELPHDGYVGPSERFTITWYWRCVQSTPGSYQIFLHVDGEGNRLNGDHDPVDGKYPVRLWDEGDIVVDRQELTVPANYRAGIYTLYVGFFSGDTRLRTVGGPADAENRARPGTLRVR